MWVHVHIRVTRGEAVATCAELRVVRQAGRPAAIVVVTRGSVARLRGVRRRRELGSPGGGLRFRTWCSALGWFRRGVRAALVGVQDMLEVPGALGDLRASLGGTWCRRDEGDWEVGLLGRDWRQRGEVWDLVVEGALVIRISRSRRWQARVRRGVVGAAALGPVLQEGGRVGVVVRKQKGI